MKILLSFAVLALSGAAALYYLNFFQKGNEVNTVSGKSFYDLSITALDGKTKINFKDFKGKKVLCVNTASKCGLTGQYKALQKLYDQYKNNDFVIVGFPTNDFLWQEPGSNKEIAKFCEKNYGVTFSMMSKIKVKGSEMHPLYQFLTQIDKNGIKSSSVSWNFQKYLIGRDGKLEKIITPRTSPMSDEIVEWVNENVLAAN